ncbi:MAG: hypothetical protein JW809_07605 [Pirellulales bacterium]|nr:hypothetical protein [Pirellulales bacterium]
MLHGVDVFTVAAVLLLILLGATGLLGVWVALGRGHWFIRTLGLAAWLGMWLLVPAHEIAAILFFESLVVVPPLLLARQLRARVPGGPLVQFGLRDLLLLVVVVAVVAAAGTAAPRSVWTSWEVFKPMLGVGPEMPPWLFFAIVGTVHGLFVLLGTWIALGRARLAVRLWNLCMTLLGLSLLFVAGELSTPGPAIKPGGLRNVGPEAWFRIALTVFLVLVLPVVVLGAIRLTRKPPTDHPSERRSTWQRVHRWTAGVLACALMAGLLAPSLTVFYVLMTPPPITEEPLPVPNGYDTLLRVGTVLEDLTAPEEDPSLTPEQRAEPSAAYPAFRRQRDALVAEARAALDMPCRAPVMYDLDYASNIVTPMIALRGLMRIMVSEASLATANGDDAAAVDLLVDVVRLGRKSAQGGVSTHRLVGFAIEGAGLYGLHDIHESLSGAARRDVRRRLLDVRKDIEPLDACWDRDTVWRNHVHGWQGRLVCAIQETNGEDTAIKAYHEDAEKRMDAQCQILLAELALADYRDEHGAYPETLDALAPAYLDETPRDPYGAGPLVYRTTDKGYELYSVGQNGLDDGRKSVFTNIDPTGDDVWFWE